MRALLNDFLDRLDPAPVRVWSLIVTIYGDCVMPRGGELWLGTLTELLAAFGIEAGSVRAAMSRLARDGFLERTRAGRTSHYALSPEALRLSRRAERLIYRNTPPEAAPGWDLVILPAARPSDRKRLAGEGYGALMAGVFARPHEGNGARLEGAFHLAATGDDRALAAALYPLPEIAERYRVFAAAVPLVEAAAASASPYEAAALRIALVHGFRRVVLRDPHLAAGALPADWPAAPAYAGFAAAYRALLPRSEVWFGENAQNAGGAAPPPEISSRFADPARPDV